jgi:hypothetical protein
MFVRAVAALETSERLFAAWIERLLDLGELLSDVAAVVWELWRVSATIGSRAS